MDQGLAGILGALVGAVATGGGALGSARSSSRLHKRQARREACKYFLSTANTFNGETQKLISHVEATSSFLHEDSQQGVEAREIVTTSLESLIDTLSEMRDAATSVMMEGIRTLTDDAFNITNSAGQLLMQMAMVIPCVDMDMRIFHEARVATYEGIIGFAHKAQKFI